MVGRSRELDALEEALDDLAERGGAFVLHGDAGIGKSILLHAAARNARARGYLVLETTGVESETGLPYAGLLELLRPILDTAAELSAPQRRALLSAFGIADDPAPQPFLIALAALNVLTSVAARQPLVLIVDDVHWLDGPSHDALSFLSRRVAADRILIIGAVRRGHDGSFPQSRRPHC